MDGHIYIMLIHFVLRNNACLCNTVSVHESGQNELECNFLPVYIFKLGTSGQLVVSYGGPILRRICVYVSCCRWVGVLICCFGALDWWRIWCIVVFGRNRCGIENMAFIYPLRHDYTKYESIVDCNAIAFVLRSIETF